MSRKRVLWIGGAVLLAALALLIAFKIIDELASLTFDRTVWRANEYPDRTRLLMSRDLIKRKALIGKTEREVVELLGRPGSTDDWRSGRKILHYWVGDVWSLGPAFLSFAIELNPDGKVVRCELRRKNF